MRTCRALELGTLLIADVAVACAVDSCEVPAGTRRGASDDSPAPELPATVRATGSAALSGSTIVFDPTTVDTPGESTGSFADFLGDGDSCGCGSASDFARAPETRPESSSNSAVVDVHEYMTTMASSTERGTAAF
jgi:hypothetical protein